MSEVAEKKKVSVHSEPDEKTLCRHGFHEWIIKGEKRLHVASHKMMDVYRCSHCGKEKLE